MTIKNSKSCDFIPPRLKFQITITKSQITVLLIYQTVDKSQNPIFKTLIWLVWIISLVGKSCLHRIPISVTYFNFVSLKIDSFAQLINPIALNRIETIEFTY